MTIKVWSMSPTYGYFAKEGLDYLQSRGYQVDMIPQKAILSEDEISETLKRYDAVIGGGMRISANSLKEADGLKIITQPGVGVDHIDVAAATAKGIPVTNTPGANRYSVMELTFGLFISLARQIPYGQQAVRQGQWPKVMGGLLRDKTLGIIGMGTIGKTIAKMGLAFGMKVVGYDIYPDEDFAEKNNIKYLELEEILKQSDFISLHVFLSDQTKNLIGMKQIEMMKPTAFLVNMARGGVVNEDDLYKAMSEKMIAGAALDVLSQEPPRAEVALSRLDNVIVTPHMGGYALEVSRDCGLICSRNIHAFFTGEKPENVVNPETLKHV